MANMMIKYGVVVLTFILIDIVSRDGTVVNAIYNGRKAPRNKFLWNVQVRTEAGLKCHGALLASKWVLTLATCVKMVDLRDVVVGDYDRSIIGDGEEVVTIKQVIIHPEQTFLVNNVALIELNSPVNVSSPSIEPVTRLANYDLDGELLDTDRKCQIAGWGETMDEGAWKLADILQELKVEKELDSVCASLGLTRLSHYSCFKMPKFHSGPCGTDNGVPVVYRIKSKPVLVGLMFGQFNVDGCVGGVKIVSKASSFKTWIKEYIPEIQ